MQKYINKCLYCDNNEMIIREIECPHCGVRVSGNFQIPDTPFENLSEKQVGFMLNYIRCEGRFNRLEEELNLSYPTLRNRLNDLILALGFDPGKETVDEELQNQLSSDKRKQILDDLHDGKLSFDEAQKKLKNEV